MAEWASYRLSDFILFSDTAYYRQFELYNEAIWPLQFVALLFSLVMLYALWKKPGWGGRAVGVILVVSWLWVAWAYLYQRLDQLHVVADKYALGFVVQAVLLAWFGVVKNRFELVNSRGRVIMGTVLLAVALVIYPLIAVLSGRPWMQFELFAFAPDPTVLATLAILLRYKAAWLLYVIPLVWLLISGMTLYAIL